jgi:hypothetical protein
VRTQRALVDYALAKRATLLELFSGRVSSGDVCDAHPYLVRAARFHGEATDQQCPVCKRTVLTHVTYTYGEGFKAEINGRVRQTADLDALELEHDEFRVYVVEVCQTCGWNHLHSSYLLGRLGLPARRRRRASASSDS